MLIGFRDSDFIVGPFHSIGNDEGLAFSVDPHNNSMEDLWRFEDILKFVTQKTHGGVWIRGSVR